VSQNTGESNDRAILEDSITCEHRECPSGRMKRIGEIISPKGEKGGQDFALGHCYINVAEEKGGFDWKKFRIGKKNKKSLGKGWREKRILSDYVPHTGKGGLRFSEEGGDGGARQ